MVTSPFDAKSYPGWTYLFTENIDLFYDDVTAHNVEVTRPLGDRTHGMREFEMLDLNGFRLRFGQYL